MRAARGVPPFACIQVRKLSPTEKCNRLYLRARKEQIVPFPEPGAPVKIISMVQYFPKGETSPRTNITANFRLFVEVAVEGSMAITAVCVVCVSYRTKVWKQVGAQPESILSYKIVLGRSEAVCISGRNGSE